MKTALVRNGRHQRPLFAVLKRYGIGASDKFDRGLWISEADLSEIKSRMESDSSRFTFLPPTQIVVKGSSIHNTVAFEEFQELFA